MNDERGELERQVNKWIEIAEEDLLMANHAFTLTSNIPYRLIGYHSQQCNNVIDIKEKLKDISKLSRYAVAKRYPGEYRTITKEEAEEAVQLTELTKKVIRRDGFHYSKPKEE